MTIIQDGQTYAIPASDYAAMMAQQGLEVVEPTGSDAGGVREQEQQQPPSTAPANCSNPLAESLAIPSTPLPPTIPHLTPCPPPTLAQVSNPPLVKTELQAGRSAKVGHLPQPEACKATQGMKGRTNANVGTEELKGSVGAGTKLGGESGGGGGGGGGGGQGGGASMRWMTATAPPAGSRAAKQEPKRQIYPTMQQVKGFLFITFWTWTIWKAAVIPHSPLQGGVWEAGGGKEELPTNPGRQLGNLPSLPPSKLLHKKGAL